MYNSNFNIFCLKLLNCDYFSIRKPYTIYKRGYEYFQKTNNICVKTNIEIQVFNRYQNLAIATLIP